MDRWCVSSSLPWPPHGPSCSPSNELFIVVHFQLTEWLSPIYLATLVTGVSTVVVLVSMLTLITARVKGEEWGEVKGFVTSRVTAIGMRNKLAFFLAFFPSPSYLPTNSVIVSHVMSLVSLFTRLSCPPLPALTFLCLHWPLSIIASY